MSRPLIILIDDDHGPMGYVVDVLELRGFAVLHVDNTDVALGYIRNSQNRRPDAFIVDIMMPPGTEYTMEETEWGLWTGVKLIDEISNQEHLKDVPILCFSNQPDRVEVQSRINAKVSFVGKYETTPSELASALWEMLAPNR